MRGGVPFDACGQRFVLRFTTNALCRLQDRTGKALADILADIADPKLSLQSYRLLIAEGVGLPLDAAGDIIDDLGLARIDALVAEALKLAFPPVDESAGGNGAATA